MSKLLGKKKALQKISRLKSLEPAKKVVKMTALAGKGMIAEYPEQPSPKTPGRWYERGFGPKWRRADNTIGGRRTSEFHGRRWGVNFYAGGLGARIVNNSSYGKWLQAARFQSRHFTYWKTDEEVARELEPVANRLLFLVYNQELRK